MKSLLKKAKEYMISTQERVDEKISGYPSALDVVKQIKNFLKKHGLKDAHVDFTVKEDYGDLSAEMEIYAYTEKPKERILAEVEERDKQVKQRNDDKYQLYLKLKKEFGE